MRHLIPPTNALSSFIRAHASDIIKLGFYCSALQRAPFSLRRASLAGAPRAESRVAAAAALKLYAYNYASSPSAELLSAGARNKKKYAEAIPETKERGDGPGARKCLRGCN